MKGLFVIVAMGVATLSQAQSLHFVEDGCVPFQQIAGEFNGRVTESRIDILRSKYDWDTYYSAQNGMFGGPACTSAIQPDFCQEQVIAVNLGSNGTFGQLPVIKKVRALDGMTWEVVVDIRTAIENPAPIKGMFSPYIAIRTPLGPDDFDVVFVSNEGETVVELRSAPRYYRLPADWWRVKRNRR